MASVKELDDKCKKAVEHFRKELSKVRGGRATAALLDNVQVEYYGSSVPLIQMGLINTPEPRQITVQVYDASAVEAVEKAIRQSDLGLNPSRDGGLIRINIPPLTNERRTQFSKMVHKLAEEARISIRNLRREANDFLKKNEKSEDLVRKGQDDIQKIIDKFIVEIDAAASAKEKEIAEV